MHLPPARTLYRRVAPKLWQEQDGVIRIAPAALLPRAGEGLSVFFADIVPSPRYLFEDYTNKKLLMLNDPTVTDQEKVKIQRNLDRGIWTPEALYRERWRIISFPITLLPKNVFHFDPVEGEPDGHVNIVGAYEDFQLYALEWVSAETLYMLDQDDTLR